MPIGDTDAPLGAWLNVWLHPRGAPEGAGVVAAVSPDPKPRRFRGLPRIAVAGRRVPVAATGLSRLLGLALLRPERAGHGLLIPGCRSVHTFGMRFPLHVVFLDRRLVPVSVRGSLSPNRIAREPRAWAVLELPGWRS